MTDEPRRRGRSVGAAVSALVGRVGAAGGFALSSILLARQLDKADFGVVTVLTSIATATSFIAAAGLNRVLLRDVAGALALGERARVLGDVRTAVRVLAISTPIGAAATLALARVFVPDTAWPAVAMAAAVTVGLAVLLVGADLLRGLGEVTVSNLTTGRSGGALGLALFCAVLVLWQAALGPTEAMGAYAAAVGVAAAVAVGAVVVRLRSHHAHPRPDGDTVDTSARAGLWSTARAGWPFAVTQLALFLTSQVDLWVASGSLGDAAAGTYGAALRLMTLVSLPLQAAQLTVVARIAALHATGRRIELQQRSQRAALVAGLPALVVLVPCIVVPGLLLETLFGPEYAAAALPLQALALAQAVNVASGLCGVVLSMTGHERAMLVTALAGAGATAALAYVGGQLDGIDGLAVGSAVSTATMFAALWLLARVRAGVWTHPWPARLTPPGPAGRP